MRGLSDRGRILFLLAIVAGVAVVTAAMSIWLLYRTALDEGRSRLVETAQSQARLIEAVARFDAAHDHGDVQGGAGAATLSQITDAHERYQGFGETGEFTLARREADEIVFLLSHRHYDLDTPKPVPWESSLAEPMRRALSGQSGTVIGLDYRGALVLAAYEPVAELDFGIVAKIDMAEVRRPFLKAAGLSGLGVLLIVVLGAVAGRRIGNPMFERLRAEEALKASEAQLDEALEAMSEGFIYFDSEGRFIRCNSKHRELFPSHAEAMVPGARFEDLLRKQLENIRLPWAEGREEEWIAERLAQHRNPGAPIEQEFIDGRVIRLSEYKTKSGGTVSIRADITESKRVEKALRESEERFRRSVVDAPIPVIMHADDGEVLMVSRKWTELSGYSLADIPTILDWTEKAYGGDRLHRDRQREVIDSLYDMEEPNEHEALITTASGEKRLWEVRDAPLGRLADGRRFVISMIVDVTERKQAEEALRESEERFRAITEASPVPLIITRRSDGEILYANPKVGPAFGLAADDVVGRPVTEFYGDPSGREERLAALNEDGYVRDNEIEMRRADGSSISTIHSLQAIEYRGEDAVLGGFYDITERKRLEEQLRQAQKMEAVGQLTGGVAHDFNNLLAAILGHAEIAEDLLGGNDRSTQAIIAAAERGAELTQRLLAFSRRQSLDSRPINLGDLIGDLHQLLRRTLGETIDIEISSAPSLWNAIADSGQLENALLNLAINARDAMPDGGKLTIETANLSLSESDVTSHMEVTPGDYVSLSVSDSGMGMPLEVAEHAFDPFFTTKDVGEGSGLGLSMVYGFAKQSGGDVTIESEPGQGTTVRLFLPRAQESIEQATKGDRPCAPRGRGENVLVIEDDSDVRVMAEKMLENLGYRVWSAENARAGLDILEAEPAMDLMLSDVVLTGGMSGPDMVERARAFRPEIKVLFMSGHAEQSIYLRTPLPEGSDLLDKPFRTIELAQRVRAVLDR